MTMNEHLLDRIGWLFRRLHLHRTALWFWTASDNRRLEREINEGKRHYDSETRSWPRIIEP